MMVPFLQPLSTAAPQDAASRLPFELLLFLVAVVITLGIAGVFIFGVLRHADRDSQGRRPSADRDRGAS